MDTSTKMGIFWGIMGGALVALVAEKRSTQIGLMIGGGVLGGLAAARNASAAAPPAAPGAPAATPLTSGSTLTLQSGVPYGSFGLAIGDVITVQLPPGAGWTSGNQTPTTRFNSDGTPATVTWTYQGPGTIVLDWTDATSQPQETTLAFYTITR
jgi:hypothetical protein